MSPLVLRLGRGVFWTAIYAGLTVAFSVGLSKACGATVPAKCECVCP
jgi:hypothetical protein